MSRRLVLRVQAEHDIDEAASWYESEKAGLGLKFIQDVNLLLERIEDNPFQFPVIHGETRRGMARRFPYGAFFTVGEENIVVLAVVHLHRHPDTWKKR